MSGLCPDSRHLARNYKNRSICTVSIAGVCDSSLKP
ncbi:hypothetical protein CPL00368_CDS0142 [Klebsiella phage DevonBitter]